MERLEFRAMGSEMLAILDPLPGTGPHALGEVPGWFADWEQHLSRFREDSELSQLNRAQGEWHSVSPVLWEVAGAAFEAAARSGGLVSPALLDALEATGYDRSFELVLAGQGIASQTSGGGVGRTGRSPRILSWWTIERDAARRALRLPRGLRLDFGGIAKGWAADRAAEILGNSGPSLVDAGGDIAVSGPLPDGSGWPIGVADPRAPDGDLEVLVLERGGVATSGRDYRRWQHRGVWLHHILDPRTGQPASTDVLSATVIAPTACEAEAAAKTALIVGSGEGIAWLDASPSLAGLLVLEDGQVVHSRRLREYVLA